jgi:hypothetical protein
MFKWLSKLFKRSDQGFSDIPEIKNINSTFNFDTEKFLKDLKNKDEMKMLLKDFNDRNKTGRGGGSSSSPISR